MQIVTANMFSHSPFRASIDLMYRYQRYHERLLKYSKHVDEIREEMMDNLAKYRSLEYYNAPLDLDIKC